MSRDLPGLLRFAGIFVARSAGLEPATFFVRSHSPSQTGRDSGGQGETNQRFHQVLALLEGQGETPDCGQIAVKICARKRNFPGGIERVPEREGPAYAVAYAFTSPSTLVDCKIGTLLRTYTSLIAGRLLRESQNSSSCQVLTRVLTQILVRKDQCLVGEKEVCQKRTFLTQPHRESPLCEQLCSFLCYI